MPMDRMQILLTPDQRRRLAAAADARDEPVAVLIREAIDSAFPAAAGAAERRDALVCLLRPRADELTPERLDALLEDRFDLPG